MSDESAPELLQNEGGWDRILRGAVALGLLLLGLSGFVAAPYDAWLRVATIPLFATALLGWCPIYQALDFSTRRAGRRSDAATPAPSTHPLRAHAK